MIGFLLIKRPTFIVDCDAGIVDDEDDSDEEGRFVDASLLKLGLMRIFERVVNDAGAAVKIRKVAVVMEVETVFRSKAGKKIQVWTRS